MFRRPARVDAADAPAAAQPTVSRTTSSKRIHRILTRREQIWIFIEDNTVVNVGILVVIIFSTLCFVLETEFDDEHLDPYWFGCARTAIPFVCAPPHSGATLACLLPRRRPQAGASLGPCAHGRWPTCLRTPGHAPARLPPHSGAQLPTTRASWVRSVWQLRDVCRRRLLHRVPDPTLHLPEAARLRPCTAQYCRPPRHHPLLHYRSHVISRRRAALGL